MCDCAINVANCKRQNMSLLLLRNYEHRSLWPTGTSLLWGRTPRKHQGGLVSPRDSLGRAVELCLCWPAQTDLARGSSTAGTHKPNMAARQEKKNSPLCLVNPKRPIGLKWFQLVVLGVRYTRGGFPAPSPSDCSCSLWTEAMQMPPAFTNTTSQWVINYTHTRHVK